MSEPAGESSRRSGGRSLRIGLTGPIGCGKSTVAAWLAGRGAVVVDADDVARAVMEPGGPVHSPVLDAFGTAIRATDGSVDRAALARIAFADPDRLRQLEAIVHPAVRPRLRAAVEAAEEAGTAIVVIEAIKLVESGLAGLCDETWLVTCDPAAQAARLTGRGATGADAAARIASQAGIRARLAAAATRVIDTSGSLDAAHRLVDAALDDALRTARRQQLIEHPNE